MKPSLLDRRNRNFVPLLVLLILLLQGATALCLFGQWLALHRLAKKDLAFVQTRSGESFPARAVDETTRQPETIRRFVSKTMYLLFNWSGEIAGAEGQRTPDPGQEIEIDGTKIKVPTAALYASYALAQNLQKPLLKKIAGIVPPGAFNGNTQAVLVLERVSAPKEIAPGQWEVRVVGQHQIVRGDLLPGKSIPFTKRVLVQPLSVPLVPAGESPLQQAIYSIRTSGLQIYAIHELDSGE